MKRLRSLALGLILALTPGCCLMWDVTNGSHSIAPGLPRGTTSSHNLFDSRQGARTVDEVGVRTNMRNRDHGRQTQ
jgi:hypothetical protein